MHVLVAAIRRSARVEARRANALEVEMPGGDVDVSCEQYRCARGGSQAHGRRKRRVVLPDSLGRIAPRRDLDDVSRLGELEGPIEALAGPRARPARAERVAACGGDEDGRLRRTYGRGGRNGGCREHSSEKERAPHPTSVATVR